MKVYNSVVNNTTLVHLSDNNHSIAVTIIPEAGAMLHEFIIPVNGQPFNVIENYSLDQPVRGQVTNYFKSVKLSPWPCRLAGGRYQFNGKAYQVQRMFSDGTALHGLLFDQPFNIVDQFSDDQSAYVLLKHAYKGYDEGYPFKYNCEVKYALHPDGLLEVETIVTNTGSQSIPIADGWHPYFKLGGKVDDWELYFEASAMLEFDEHLVPTGNLIPYDRFNEPALIGQVKMDNCFVLDNDEGQPACMLANPATKVAVSFIPDPSYPYLQLFIPDHRESVAVENLSSAPDCFNNQMGVTVLAPGTSKAFRVLYHARQIP